MRLWSLPLRLLLILALAALVSGAWLFRQDLVRMAGPRLDDAFGAGAGEPIEPAPHRAVDSVVLSAAEMTSLLATGLPPKVAAHMDSLSVELGDDRVRVSARLETAQIPGGMLGPLAGVFDAWERVTVEGPVIATAPGNAEWRVDALSVRGVTLPAQTSRWLIDRALPGARDGVVPLALPRGIHSLRIRPTGVVLYREDPR
jgi:hypothetical protein